MSTQHTGHAGQAVKWSGRLWVPDPSDRFIDGCIEGWDVERHDDGLILSPRPNLVVNDGVNRSLDRLFGIGGPPAALQTIGVDDGAANPASDSRSSTSGNGGSDTGSTNRRLVAFDATPTRSSQTVSADGTFTNSNVSFTMKRLFFSAAAAGTTDTAGDLYSMTNVFTIDLSAFSTWSLTFTGQVTGAGS